VDADLACTNFSQENYRKIQTLSLKPGGLSLCRALVPPSSQRLTATLLGEIVPFFQPLHELL
jgi:hypothetical protein